MGLDISYYRGLKPVRTMTADDRENGTYYDEGLTTFYDNRHFSGRIGSLDPQTCYSSEDGGGFRAGSYGGYNQWRAELARLVGIRNLEAWWKSQGDAAPEGPFAELICFSDCEGTIGPEVSAKLAKDFQEWDERAKTFRTRVEDNWFYRLYQQWKTAFETAADNGAVDFH